MKSILTILALSVLLGCSSELEPIKYGKDECHYCSMKIMDPKFGAEAVTDKGRVYTFDSGECLLRYLKESANAHAHLAVTNFNAPKTLIQAEQSWFLMSENVPSPMGAYLSAYANKQEAAEMQSQQGGDLFDWNQLQEQF